MARSIDLNTSRVYRAVIEFHTVDNEGKPHVRTQVEGPYSTARAASQRVSFWKNSSYYARRNFARVVGRVDVAELDWTEHKK